MMKVRIPFSMFDYMEGEIEIEFDEQFGVGMSKEELEFRARYHAERAGQFLGAFKDEFQRVLLGYERIPGIKSVFWTLEQCEKDEVLRKRLLHLLEDRQKGERDGETKSEG